MNRIRLTPIIARDRQAGKDAIKGKTIKDFNCCPHCGGSFGYYRKFVTEGYCTDGTSWEGEKQNTEMYDPLIDIWNSTYLYCAECHKAICKHQPQQ